MQSQLVYINDHDDQLASWAGYLYVVKGRKSKSNEMTEEAYKW